MKKDQWLENQKIQLLEKAKKFGEICNYIWEKKQKNSRLIKEDLEKIDPDIFVFELLALDGPGPLEYDDMVCEQIGNMIEACSHSSYGWNKELMKLLLTEAGVTQVTKIETNFGQKPTGDYVIDGIFHNDIPFHIYNRVGTE